MLLTDKMHDLPDDFSGGGVASFKALFPGVAPVRRSLPYRLDLLSELGEVGSNAPPTAAIRECQGGELNSRPRAYESPALPLSYPGSEESQRGGH
jgi:hypothetical protein